VAFVSCKPADALVFFFVLCKCFTLVCACQTQEVVIKRNHRAGVEYLYAVNWRLDNAAISTYQIP